MYDPPTESALHQATLDAYQNRLDGADVREGGELWCRAWVVSAATAHLSLGLRYVEDQIFPSSADADNLARHADLMEVDRLQATTATASGQVELTGINGTVVASGLTLRSEDGIQFELTAGGTISGGTLTVAFQALDAGAAGNCLVGTLLTFDAPPAGVNATAEVVAELTGGTDLESLESWAARVVERIREGDGANTATDYERWAESVDGVIEAHCLPLRRGPGTVSVAVFTADGSGNRQPAGAPLRATVLAYIDTVRPVTAEVDCPPITEISLNVTVQDIEVEAGFDEAEVLAAVQDAIEAWIWDLTTGETALLTQLGRAVANVAGVNDYTIVAPALNTEVTTVQILVPGTITVTAA